MLSWLQPGKQYEQVVEKRPIQVNGKPIQILKLYILVVIGNIDVGQYMTFLIPQNILNHQHFHLI